MNRDQALDLLSAALQLPETSQTREEMIQEAKDCFMEGNYDRMKEYIELAQKEE